VPEALTIDIWSDVCCPFCALGHRQLLHAVERFEHADHVAIQFHAFELDPRSPASFDRSLSELVARKYGLDHGRAEAFHRGLETEAAQLGLTWDFSTARAGNTREAHRLIAWAARQGRGQAMVERLFAAYFGEGELMSDHETLIALGTEVGVDTPGSAFEDPETLAEVLRDEDDAVELGISGVPATLVDRRFIVSGARSPEEFLGVLQRAWDRRVTAP
jgi:predicted DsbA family dithiol-disulfide isomerase